MRTINRDDIDTLTLPRRNQGQIVEISYGWLQDGSGTIVRRWYDRSDLEELWSIADGSDLPEGYDFEDGEPRGLKWTSVQVTEASSGPA